MIFLDFFLLYEQQKKYVNSGATKLHKKVNVCIVPDSCMRSELMLPLPDDENVGEPFYFSDLHQLVKILSPSLSSFLINC